MTEQEWLVCGDPRRMLEYALTVPKREPDWGMSNRKLWLFVLAILDNCPNWKNDHTWEADHPGRPDFVIRELSDWIEKDIKPSSKNWTTEVDGGRMQTGREAALRLVSWREDEEPFPARRADFLREILGNPWKPINCKEEYQTDDGWGVTDRRPAPWLTSLVLNMARRIYDEKDWEAMPVLADALEEAGCGDYRILDHLREKPQQIYTGHGDHEVHEPFHCRGCYVLDTLLGKE